MSVTVPVLSAGAAAKPVLPAARGKSAPARRLRKRRLRASCRPRAAGWPADHAGAARVRGDVESPRNHLPAAARTAVPGPERPLQPHAGGLQPVENPDEFRHRVRPCPDTIAACARPRRALPARSSTLRPGPAQRPGAARFRSARFLHAARPEATTRASVQPLRYGLRVSRKSLPRGVGPHSPGRDRLCFSARHPRRFVYLLEHCIAPGTCPDLPR